MYSIKNIKNEYHPCKCDTILEEHYLDSFYLVAFFVVVGGKTPTTVGCRGECYLPTATI